MVLCSAAEPLFGVRGFMLRVADRREAGSQACSVNGGSCTSTTSTCKHSSAFDMRNGMIMDHGQDMSDGTVTWPYATRGSQLLSRREQQPLHAAHTKDCLGCFVGALNQFGHPAVSASCVRPIGLVASRMVQPPPMFMQAHAAPCLMVT